MWKSPLHSVDGIASRRHGEQVVCHGYFVAENYGEYVFLSQPQVVDHQKIKLLFLIKPVVIMSVEFEFKIRMTKWQMAKYCHCEKH